MAARAGVEPTTLRLKAIDSTNAPPCPTNNNKYAYRIRKRIAMSLWGQSPTTTTIIIVLLIKNISPGTLGGSYYKVSQISDPPLKHIILSNYRYLTISRPTV